MIAYMIEKYCSFFFSFFFFLVVSICLANNGNQPLDLTLLDKHFGNITMWQDTVDEIHARGMYVLLDNTMAT